MLKGGFIPPPSSWTYVGTWLTDWLTPTRLVGGGYIHLMGCRHPSTQKMTAAENPPCIGGALYNVALIIHHLRGSLYQPLFKLPLLDIQTSTVGSTKRSIYCFVSPGVSSAFHFKIPSTYLLHRKRHFKGFSRLIHPNGCKAELQNFRFIPFGFHMKIGSKNIWNFNFLSSF